MKHSRKILSFVLAAIMIFASLPFAGVVTAFAASTRASTVTASSDLKFVVPEAIYLFPDAKSSQNASSTPFQFFVNNNNDGTVKTAYDNIGYIYYSLSGAGNATVSGEFLTEDLGSLSGGSISLSSSTVTNGSYVTVSRSSTSPSLAASTNGCYIRWTLSYTDPADSVAKKAYAYTYVYKPYTVPVAAGTDAGTGTSGGANWAGSILWISGFHSLTDGGKNSKGDWDNDYWRYTNLSNFSAFISKEATGYVGGTATTGSNSRKNGKGQTTYNTWHSDATTWYTTFANSSSLGYYLQIATDSNPSYIGSDSASTNTSSVHNFMGGKYRENTKNVQACIYNASYGNLYIDTSRYTDLKQIPNLGIGMFVCDDEDSGGTTGGWYIADFTGRSTSGYNTWHTGADNGGSYYSDYGTLYAQQGTGRTDQPSDETEGMRYAGAWPRALAGTTSSTSGATYDYMVKSAYGNHDGGYYAWSHNVCKLHAIYYNKGTLRTAVMNALKKFPQLGVSGISGSNITSCYFDANTSYKWTAFQSAFTAAYKGLTQLNNTSNTATLATNLNNALAALCTKVTLNANGGSLGTLSATNYPTIGTAATISYTPGDPADRTGYDFLGWNKSSSATTGASSVTVGYNETLYAIWKIHRSNVTIYPNGGTWNGSTENKTYWQNYNTTLSVPDPTRDGYTFTGWTFGGDSNGSFNSSTKVYTYGAGKDKTDTLTAGWTATKYTITYNTDGGEALSSQDYYITSTNVSLPTPVKSGYSFTGWKPTANVGNWSSSSTYTAGTSVNGKWGNVTLKAQWSKDTYTIGYTLNGGTATGNPTSYQVDTPSFTLNNPTKTGYQFKGWSGTGLSGDNNTSVTILQGSTGNRSYTANWTANVYNILFDKNDASSSLKATGSTAGFAKTYGVNKTLTANGFVRNGYTFRGWATSADGAKVYNDGATLTTDLATENGAVVTLYAVWEPIDYTLTFDTDGGDAMAAKAYTADSTDTLATPTKTGYTFTGWTVKTGAGNWVVNTDVADGASLNGKYGSAELKAHWTPNTYTVKYDKNGGVSLSGEELPDKNATYDVTFRISENLYYTRLGYEFLGWSTDPDATAADYEEFQEVGNLTAAPNGEVTLYAVWQAIDYTIYLKLNSGSYNGQSYFVTLTTTAHIGDVISLDVPTRTGYDFLGWTLFSGSVDALTNNADGTASFTMVDSTVTLEATWEAHGYKLWVDPNGGIFKESTAVTRLGGVYNDEIGDYESQEIAPPYREGYLFTGWTYVAGDGDGVWTYDAATQTGTYKFSGDGYLTANWTPITYTIRFDADGGEGTMADIPNVAYDTTVTLTANGFTKTGYDFGGWQLGEDTYADGDPVTNLSSTQGDIAVLKAIWLPHHYTVRFHANGGSGEMADQSFVYGTAQALNASGFTMTGNHVAGWATSADGAIVYTDKQEVNELTATDGGVVDLYAVWQGNAYTVKFNANGGEGAMADEAYVYGETKALTANTFTRTGYLFSGWAETASGAKVYDDAQLVSNLAEDHGVTVNLYAVWTPIEYTVVYHANNGTDATLEQIFTYDRTATMTLNTFTKTGYTFVKWTANADGTGASYGNGYTVGAGTNLSSVDGDTIDLYVQWRANPYTVRFNSNAPAWYPDGEQSRDQDFTYDEAQDLLANIYAFDGFTFLGWAKSANGAAEYTDGQNVTNLATAGMLELYAVWQPVEYTFTVDDSNGNITTEAFTLDANQPFYQLPVPEKEGYHLIGWDLTFGDGTTETVRFDTFTLDSGSYNFPATYSFSVNLKACDITAKAVWRINKYRVNFDNPYTGQYDTLVAEHGESLADRLPEAAELVRCDELFHYRFVNWTPIDAEGFENVTAEFSAVATYETEAHESYWTRAEGDDAYLAPTCDEMGHEDFVCVC
ncbi:MAG: InlB B-repeat-containing protein, partial [Clostridia bacterium]|nr:InlB B-repeat-containing protein [Clostridia bacterium]